MPDVHVCTLLLLSVLLTVVASPDKPIPYAYRLQSVQRELGSSSIQKIKRQQLAAIKKCPCCFIESLRDKVVQQATAQAGDTNGPAHLHLAFQVGALNATFAHSLESVCSVAGTAAQRREARWLRNWVLGQKVLAEDFSSTKSTRANALIEHSGQTEAAQREQCEACPCCFWNHMHEFLLEKLHIYTLMSSDEVDRWVEVQSTIVRLHRRNAPWCLPDDHVSDLVDDAFQVAWPSRKWVLYILAHAADVVPHLDSPDVNFRFVGAN